jgi:CheY-like chemotaxis protein
MPKKILLVDDTETIIALEKLILGSDFYYLEAHNGAEAFDKALITQPDLILMDLNMPVRDGIEGLRGLKANPRTMAIPVVIVSTRTEAHILELCRSLGCADFVAKPIESDQLQSSVRRILAGLG